MLEIKIPASRAVRVARKREGHHRSMKSQIAGMAAPGPQAQHRGQMVQCAASVGPKTIDAPALWADHGWDKTASFGAAEYRIAEPQATF
jgi:hypothetical protein